MWSLIISFISYLKTPTIRFSITALLGKKIGWAHLVNQLAVYYDLFNCLIVQGFFFGFWVNCE